MNEPTLAEVAAFLALVERGGFAVAANELGVTQSTISRRIAALEERVGVQLVMRTTRRIALTEAGQTYAQELRDLLAGLRDAHARVRNVSPEPEGIVRITMPTALGRTRVMPVIARLNARYSKLRFDIDLSDRYVDMLDGSYDLALRLADPPGSGLRAEEVGRVKVGMYASANYAKSRGLPNEPSDLASHSILALRTYSPLTQWQGRWNQEPLSVTVTPSITVTDSSALKSLTLEGAGISLLPDYLIDDEVCTRALVEVMPAFRFTSRPVYLVYLTHREEMTKVQAVRDAIREEFCR